MVKNVNVVSKFLTSLFAFVCVFLILDNKTTSAAEVNQQEKEALHQQYIEILNEVKSTVQWGDSLDDIEVAPISEFKEEDWVSVEVFKQRAIDATQANAVEIERIKRPSKGITPLSTDNASHDLSIKHGTTDVIISVSASFTTYLYNGRQVFSNYSNLKTTASKGTFTRTGVDARIIDGGRTFTFTIGGTLTYVGLVSTHTLNTDFLCSTTGQVS